MTEGKRILAVIPARGGSKGVPGKNIRILNGKPLIQWTIDAAKKSRHIERLILSSDDDAIINVALGLGCEVPFKRPSCLAQDDTPGIDPILHSISQLPGYDYVVILQPTSPLRTTSDIDGAIEMCISKGANSCVSICSAQENPFWMYQISEENTIIPFLEGKEKYNRRQDVPAIYKLNGAIYVVNVNWLLQSKKLINKDTIGFVMPVERSIDIDTELDLIYLKAMQEVNNEKV